MEYNQKKFSKKINLGNLIAHLVELESTAAAKVLNPTHASMSPIFFILSKLSYQNKTLSSFHLIKNHVKLIYTSSSNKKRNMVSTYSRQLKMWLMKRVFGRESVNSAAQCVLL